MMTEYENFRAVVEHRRPEWTPFGMSFTPDLEKRVIEHIGTNDIAAHYGMDQRVWAGPKAPEGFQGPDHRKYWDGFAMPDGAWINGLGVVEVPGGFHHFTRYISPLRNATSFREIEDYAVADATAFDWSPAAQAVAKAHADGKSTTVFIGHMYENAWQARGYEPFLLDTIERPEWAECMLDKFFRNNLHAAAQAARAGVDLIYCGDDVANQNALMFSKDTWRRLILSRWAKVWQAVNDINPRCVIAYHTDGNCMDIVAEMLDAGLDFLNPVQPECLDTDALKARFGKRLGMDGCMGTQSTMPFGTPDDVRRRVKECVAKYGQSGGLMLAPTHVLEPEVPLANIDAYASACREYGRLG
jgi:uroporphyrinogen decarboxylase